MYMGKAFDNLATLQSLTNDKSLAVLQFKTILRIIFRLYSLWIISNYLHTNIAELNPIPSKNIIPQKQVCDANVKLWLQIYVHKTLQTLIEVYRLILEHLYR